MSNLQDRAAARLADPAVLSDRVPFTTWLAVIGATLGAFMAVLNIQITNAALPDIQGAIGAGIDDGGWISTSYLITEIIVIPLSGWLARVFSLRRYLLVNAFLFLAFSVACASAQNLGQMIVLRAFQGFTGGVLIPLAATIILTMLPKSKQAVGFAMFALSATFAPAIGPTIGGWLNDTYGWQYIFYVNLIPGAIMLGLLALSLKPSPMRLDLLPGGDWPGIATMAIGLAALQTMLEEGNKDDWFGSPFIVRLGVVTAIALPAFVAIELTTARPLLNLRLLARRNFGLGTLASFLLGYALYGSVFILPLYLSQTQGYNAQQIGEVLAWTGLPQLVLIPLVPKLLQRFDAKQLVAVGFALFAGSAFMSTHLDADFAGPQFLLPNIIRAFGQALVLTPLSLLTTGGIEAENAGSASALYNMMRNLGGAIGIAILQTAYTRREQFHSNILGTSVSLTNPATQQRLTELAQYFQSRGVADPATAWHQAVVAVGDVVRDQAAIMGYADAFFLLGSGLVIALLVALCLRKTSGGSAAGAH